VQKRSQNNTKKDNSLWIRKMNCHAFEKNMAVHLNKAMMEMGERELAEESE